ncbi:hypothetical protein [Hymenobacter chitinivorans]|uniref:4-amino-4-deoxy-L-arabinose transferase-like glycosyltransferase n=1 Tax=Hymenobacter chitinivorans DSM 11115 TaxID=1121954 RepID=A0A2M9BLY9_9BACT|nr:hypothetical protein [Hymenobacter chitinivorans]PJJ58974.1 4-amino-4-deoxy-L-arabinose transferase-like glycosyltransferase [Hymenobacter chitinivorans DSM 11115]
MKFVKYFISFLFVVALAVGISFILMPRAALVEMLVHQVGLAAYADKIKGLLTESLLVKAKVGLGVLELGLGLLLAALWYFWPSIEAYLRTLGQQARQLGAYLTTVLRPWTFGQRLVLFGLFLVLTFLLFYCAYSIPFIYDELYTYIAFSSRGPVVSLVFYPFPNNHVLVSVLAGALLKVVGSVVFGMRATTVLSSMLLYWVLVVGLQRWVRPVVVLTALIFFFGLDMVLLYSFMARGYTIILLCTAVSFCVVPELLKPQSRYRQLSWLLLGLVSIVGMAAILTYVYCFASIMILLGIYALLKRQPKISQLIVLGLLVVAGVALFYTPLVIVSGLSALIKNKYVVPISRPEVLHKMLPAMGDLIYAFFTFKALGWVWLLVLVLGAVAFWRRRSAGALPQPLAVLSLLMLVLPMFFMLAQSVVPYERCWQYLAVPLAYLLALALEAALASFGPRPTGFGWLVSPAMATLMFALTVRSAWGFYQKLYEHEHHSFSYRRVGELLTEQGFRLPVASPPTYLVDSFLADGNVEYDFTTQHRTFKRQRLDVHPQRLDSVAGPALVIHDKHFGLEPAKYLTGHPAQTLYDDQHVTVFLVNSAPVKP